MRRSTVQSPPLQLGFPAPAYLGPPIGDRGKERFKTLTLGQAFRQKYHFWIG